MTNFCCLIQQCPGFSPQVSARLPCCATHTLRKLLHFIGGGCPRALYIAFALLPNLLLVLGMKLRAVRNFRWNRPPTFLPPPLPTACSPPRRRAVHFAVEMPKEIKELRDFLQTARRKDAKKVRLGVERRRRRLARPSARCERARRALSATLCPRPLRLARPPSGDHF